MICQASSTEGPVADKPFPPCHRDPIDYDLNDLRPTTFAVVSEFARRRRETAIGYVTRQGVIVLAPTAADTHLFRNTDHIVVLSKDDH